MKRYIKSSRFSNLSPIMAGTRYDKQAAKILYDGGIGSDLSVAENIIDQLFHTDLHAFNHSKPWLEKYLKGIARIIVEESGGDESKASSFIAKSIPTFNTYLTYVRKLRDKLGGTSYDDHFINEMSFEDVKKAIEDLENDYYDDLDIASSNASGYTLIPIESYEELHSQFGGHWTGDGKSDGYAGDGGRGTAWCHANSPSTYNNTYAKNGMNKFFILAANDWKDIPFNPETNSQNAKDEYGNSLIALVVNKKTGKLINSTLRSNHVGHVDGYADNQYNYKQLSAIAGFDVKEAILENLGIESVDNSARFIYSNDKYGMLANDMIEHNGHTLYRIQALMNFDNIDEDTIGGYIESLDNLSEDGGCWIDKSAKVFGNANVHGNALILGAAIVSGNAEIYGNATIYGNAKVYGNAKICGGVKVHGNAEIYGNAKLDRIPQVYENAKIFGDAEVSSGALIHGNARIGGSAIISGSGNNIFGNTLIIGNSEIKGRATIKENARIDDNAVVSEFSTVRGNSYIGGNAMIFGEAVIFGDAKVYGDACVYERAKISDNATVCGHAEVYGSSLVYGSAKVYKDAKVSGLAVIRGYARVNYDVSEGTIEH